MYQEYSNMLQFWLWHAQSFSLVPAAGPGAATKAMSEWVMGKISSFSANFDQNISIDGQIFL